ncbi:MAG: Crp/Fnr family transcriptional regulator [Sphingomonadaceae bacterium]
MNDVFVERLSSVSPLSSIDRAALLRICWRARNMKSKTHLARYGEKRTAFPVILSGWAARSYLMRDGSRQITGILIPGDICHHDAEPGQRARDEIVALSPCRIAWIDYADLEQVAADNPAIAEALRIYTRLEKSILTEWIVNIGRRDALERTAHFICEVWTRLKLTDPSTRKQFEFPITQEDLADVLGLTPVHINRKLQQLRQEGLITLQSRQLTIHNVSALADIAGFEESYLDPHPQAEERLAAAS